MPFLHKIVVFLLATSLIYSDTYNMDSITSLQSKFLIAMPHLLDPNFFHSVTLICEHNQNGSLGFLINRPLGIMLADVFAQMSITSNFTDINQQPVLAGGPLQIQQGFVIHRTPGVWQSSLNVGENINITTSRDILTAMASKQGPEQNIVLLGYSCWGAGQLEKEITENTWLIAPADVKILFDLPIEERWQAAAASIGVDMSKVTSQTGHA